MISGFLKEFNKIFDIDNKTTIPVLITLFVFALGWFLTGLSNAFKESRKRKSIKRILKKNLSDFAINLKRECKNTLITSGIFKSKTQSNFKINKNNFSQLSVFEEIGYKELFNTFHKGLYNNFNSPLRLRAVSNLWNIINSVNEWEVYVKTQLDIFNELNNKQIGLFNKSHKQYVDYIYQLLIHGNEMKTVIEKKYIMELEQTRANWQNAENHLHPDVVYETLVQPSVELNGKYTNVVNHLILPGMSFLHEMDLNYRNRNNLLSSYAGLYEVSYNFYLGNLKRVRVINSILFPSFKLSTKRFFGYMKRNKNPLKPVVELKFIPN